MITQENIKDKKSLNNQAFELLKDYPIGTFWSSSVSNSFYEIEGLERSGDTVWLKGKLISSDRYVEGNSTIHTPNLIEASKKDFKLAKQKYDRRKHEIYNCLEKAIKLFGSTTEFDVDETFLKSKDIYAPVGKAFYQLDDKLLSASLIEDIIIDDTKNSKYKHMYKVRKFVIKIVKEVGITKPSKNFIIERYDKTISNLNDYKNNNINRSRNKTLKQISIEKFREIHAFTLQNKLIEDGKKNFWDW